MKEIFITIALIFSIGVFGQENPFVGIWEYDGGTEIFRINFEENNEGRIRGDYELIEKNTGSIIYKSREDLNYGLVLKDAIRGSNFVDINILGALIKDRTINHPGYQVLIGDLKMELLNTSPYQTATWKVKRRQGVILSDDYREFNIPTDLILTKIEDNPVIDD